MKCSNCGGEMRETAKFCPYCGEKAVPEENGENPQGNTEIPKETRETPFQNEEDIGNPNKEIIPENTQKTETAEIAKETRETPETEKKTAEISRKFNEKDGLYVVSETSGEKSEIKAETVKIAEISSFSKRKFPVFKIIAAFLILVISCSAGYLIYEKSVPYIRYKNAEELFSQADYAAAEEIFSELGNYSQSAEYITECRYQKARQLMENGKYPEAADAFTSLDGYENSDALVQECMLKIAENYMENGEFEAAMSVYSAAGKSDLAETAAADRAAKYAAEGDYFTAAELAEKYCGDGLAEEYLYLGADKARTDGVFKTAADVFYRLGDYKNSAALAEECTYEFYLAEYEKNGASEETARGFYFLGEYENSRELYLQNAYEYGVQRFENGDFAAAAAMFRNAASYKDAGGQLYLARYELAKSLEEDDPASAKSIFSMLGNYRDSSSHKTAAARKISEIWYADGYTSANGYCTAVFRKTDTLTVYCTAGTEAQSPPVDLTVTLTDESGNEFSAEYENLRNSGSFSVSFPLSEVRAGTAEISVSRKDNGAVLRKFTITVAE
ncbi:MAG: zinc-ribbon domain-containing protein [Ruminococcus sp.]|nr:zinc-ribbon domain-containing protein [Ruminococcus sp.]MCM1480448.1 zinc-ribbon domain-containing protein [Muribaculaceae bacterium]